MEGKKLFLQNAQCHACILIPLDQKCSKILFSILNRTTQHQLEEMWPIKIPSLLDFCSSCCHKKEHHATDQKCAAVLHKKPRYTFKFKFGRNCHDCRLRAGQTTCFEYQLIFNCALHIESSRCKQKLYQIIVETLLFVFSIGCLQFSLYPAMIPRECWLFGFKHVIC